MKSQRPIASLDTMYKIFTIPEGGDSALAKIEKEISHNLAGFLNEHIVASNTSAKELEKAFLETAIDDDPVYVSEQADFLLREVVSKSVHTGSPSFVGHMTSALPYFMFPLAKIMFALNQNLVKIETSKAFTPLERQVIGMLHRLAYDRSESYYKKFTQNPKVALGAMCSDGTIANITCLWVALNKLYPANNQFEGVGSEGLVAAVEHYQTKSPVILCSEMGHYSLEKACNLLGIGKKAIVKVATTENYSLDINHLKELIVQYKREGRPIMAVVGIAGNTETGVVDDLNAIADICKESKVHFHVDAAWGGPTLFSSTYKNLLAGIERADSITLDAHKQLYVPVGAGLALFKNETALTNVSHHADYIIRKGSRDLGKMTLEGSRPGTAMLIHSGLKVLGRKGYELLLNRGIERAKEFAAFIQAQDDFELISNPVLNILTYRYVGSTVKSDRSHEKVMAQLNRANKQIQKIEREGGKTFVSRTTLYPHRYGKHPTVVLRVVLANPLTTIEILESIIREQREIGKSIIK